MIIKVQFYPTNKIQADFIKKYKNILYDSFYILFSMMGFYYVADGKPFEYIFDITDEQKKLAMKNLKEWNGHLQLQGIQYLRINILQKAKQLDGVKITILNNTFTLKIEQDNESSHQRIPMNFMISKSKNILVLDEINPAWNNTLTCITLIYQLPQIYWKYQIFNLLHLLEHCLLNKFNNKNQLSSNESLYSTDGFTISDIGVMRLQIITNDIKDFEQKFNKLIKSKKLNCKLEFQRLEQEMKQSIQNTTECSFMYNSDFKDNNLLDDVLYSLYSLLDLQIIVQNVGNKYISHQLNIYQPSKNEKAIHDYFYQDKFLVKQLQCFNRKILYEIKGHNNELYLIIQNNPNTDIYITNDGYIIYGVLQDQPQTIMLDDIINTDQRFIQFQNGLIPNFKKEYQFTLQVDIDDKTYKKYQRIISQLQQ